jgi:hypothetical protein
VKVRDAIPIDPVSPLKDPAAAAKAREIDQFVALLPVRYAVDLRTDDQSLYGYQGSGLKQEFPKLKQARYVLRRLRPGHLYLYAQGKLRRFLIEGNGQILADGAPTTGTDNALEIRVESQALLIPQSAGTVWLGYAEIPWSERQCRRIEADEGGIRSKAMQPFSLGGPSKDSFPLTELGKEVADYGGEGSDFEWSGIPGSTQFDSAETINALSHSAEAGQLGVALDDPIGIGRDLSTLLSLDIAEREKEKAKDRHATASAKMVLTLIDGAKLTEERVERLAKQRYREAAKSSGPHGVLYGMDHFRERARKKLQADYDALAARLRKKPDDLRRFLDKGRRTLKALQTRIEARGADACTWLRQAPDNRLGPHLDAYDRQDTATALAFEDAVTGCIGGFTDSRDGTDLLLEWLLGGPDNLYWKAIAAGEELFKEMGGDLDKLDKALALWDKIDTARTSGDGAATLQANSNTEQLAVTAGAVLSTHFKRTGRLDADVEKVMLRKRLIAQARMGIRIDRVTGDLQAIEAAIWQNFHHTSDELNGIRLTPVAKVVQESTRLHAAGRSLTVSKTVNSGSIDCLLYTSPSPRDAHESRMPSSA